MARRGNLMSVRPDIKVLDCTIRDGGLCNNFEFTDEFVRELYKTNVKSGVDYMEFGYKASRSLFKEEDHGKWKFCKEEDIRAIVGENISDMKISVMADVGRCDYKTDFLTYAEINDKDLAREKLNNAHSRQLSYYAEALRSIFGKYPDKVLIYSLPLGDTVEVDTFAILNG